MNAKLITDPIPFAFGQPSQALKVQSEGAESFGRARIVWALLKGNSILELPVKRAQRFNPKKGPYSSTIL
jgi:hypothetical protein